MRYEDIAVRCAHERNRSRDVTSGSALEVMSSSPQFDSFNKTVFYALCLSLILTSRVHRLAHDIIFVARQNVWQICFRGSCE